MKILAHRGWWLKPDEKNSLEAFRRAFNNGFGIETDIRDFNGKIVVSHDIPNSKSLLFSEFMLLLQEYAGEFRLALNVKSDGLQELIKKQLINYSDYYFFDMSVPDTLGYSKHSLAFYSRKSDIETPSLYDKCEGIWLDNFSQNCLDKESLVCFLKQGKRVALVSPELHGFEYQAYWSDLRFFLNNNLELKKLIELCTDFPGEAKEYFNV